MEVRRRAEEAVLAHLALERARRQVRVRLPAVRAVGARKTDVVLHAAPGRDPGDGEGSTPRTHATLWSDRRVSTNPRPGRCNIALRGIPVQRSDHTNLADCTATELVHLYRTGQASPVEATQAVLARIGEVDRVLNAFCWSTPSARWQAPRASEARWRDRAPLDLLDGVPVSIKDLILTRGLADACAARARSIRSSRGTSMRRRRRACAKPAPC